MSYTWRGTVLCCAYINFKKKNICDLKIILRLTHLEIKYRVFPKTKNENLQMNTTSFLYTKLISSDPAQTAQEAQEWYIRNVYRTKQKQI